MKDLTQIVESYYKPLQTGKKNLLFEELAQLIETELLEVEKEKVAVQGQETKSLPVPRFNLTEKWGLPGSADRENIERFFSKIAPEGSLQDKIAQIENFLTECDERCVNEQNIAEILANLVFLDTLSSLVFDYNANIAGYLFEAFLSALLLGRQEQAAGNKTIEDILNKDDEPVSLKLLRQGGELKGSLTLLKNTFDKWGEIKYILASKESTEELHLVFYEIILTSEDYDHLYATRRQNQFIIKPDVYQQNQIGEINVGGREQLRAIGQRYADRLGDSLFTIYELLEDLSHNINQYFLDENKHAGRQAHDDALNLQNSIKNIID